MKKLILLKVDGFVFKNFQVIFTCMLSFSSLIATAQTDEDQIKNTIGTFFEGMYKRDSMLIKSSLHPNCSLNSISIKPNQQAISKTENISVFLKSINSIAKEVKLEERLLEHKISIDEALAIDWTPYEFYVNDKLSHKGTNAFTLIKTENNWKIIAIIDTRKR